MIKIKLLCKIELYPKETGRKIAIGNGYRPLFNFVNAKTKTSGRIDLIDMTQFDPGMSGIVNITFLKGIISDHYFTAGEKFTFDEGFKVLGEGEIIKVLTDS